MISSQLEQAREHGKVREPEKRPRIITEFRPIYLTYSPDRGTPSEDIFLPLFLPLSPCIRLSYLTIEYERIRRKLDRKKCTLFILGFLEDLLDLAMKMKFGLKFVIYPLAVCCACELGPNLTQSWRSGNLCTPQFSMR